MMRVAGQGVLIVLLLTSNNYAQEMLHEPADPVATVSIALGEVVPADAKCFLIDFLLAERFVIREYSEELSHAIPSNSILIEAYTDGVRAHVTNLTTPESLRASIYEKGDVKKAKALAKLLFVATTKRFSEDASITWDE